MIKEAASQNSRDVAILGIGCRVPGAEGLLEFWRLLAEGKDSIREVPPERWRADEYYSRDIGASNAGVSKWGGFLDRVDEFDNRFFNISAREARAMDPRQRILLEEVWRAIEDSAIPLEMLRSRRTAVYVGVMSLDEPPLLAPVDGYAGSGCAGCMLANRVSHFFDFCGPSLGIDTASSSSLVALHQAKEALRSGEADYALVAGVSLNLTPWKYISFSKARMLSPDGRCKAFDRSADGYAPGEGVGVLVLQRADVAAADRNFAHGFVKGSSVNHGGLALSLTAPQVAAQQHVIEQAQADARISPETITYVEAHGSGTSLGDPIEFEALVRAFRRGAGREQFCHLGSVKTNIGHLEPAAGIAGVIKVLAMMRHRSIPASLHLQAPNPMLDLPRSPFKLVDRLTPWTSQDGRLRAGVSSFGFGGVNSHVVMENVADWERAEPLGSQQTVGSIPLPFTLSARTPASLRGLVESWIAFVKTEEFARADWRDICGTLLARKAFHCRASWWVSKLGIESALQSAREGENAAPKAGNVALALGSFANIGRREVREIARTMPVVKREWDEVCRSLNEVCGLGLSVEPSEFSQRFWEPRPALWEMSVGLLYARLARIWLPGIDLVGGEGAGLQAALFASGLIERSQALRFASAPEKGVGDLHGRPKIAFFDCGRKEVVWPVEIPDDYLPELLAQAELTPAFQRDLAERAGQLASHQPTFRRFLEEWQVPLEKAGENIWEWWKDPGSADGDNTPTGRVSLRALVAGDALRRLNKKWGLGRRGLPPQPRFLEVLALLDVGLVEREELIRFFKGGKDEAAVLTRASTARARGMGSLGRFPLLASMLRLPPGDEPSRVDAAARPLPPEFFSAGATVVRAGVLGRAPEGGLCLVEPGTDAVSQLGTALVEAWRAGLTVTWENTPWTGVSSKLSLPSYAFDRSRFGKDSAPVSRPVGAEVGIDGAARGVDSLRSELGELLMEVLRMDREQMDEGTDFRDYGMESVAITDFAESVGRRYGMELDPVLLYEHPNLRSLARYLLDGFPTKFQGRVGTGSASLPAAPFDVAPMSPIQPEALRTETRPECPLQVAQAGDLSADAVAIVGMACRFPKSDDLSQFWENLAAGRNLVSEVPPGRWRWQDFFGDPHVAENKTRSRWGGFLDHADTFDASFFKVSPREAELMDPQQRWILELVWAALEDAGCPPATLRGSATGVFVGVSNHDYQTLVGERHSRAESYTATGGQFSIIPNRVSYFFDWRGPSLAIDTACSSSLVALDAAVKAVQRGDCTAAIAGGANLCCVPGPYLSFDHAGMLSRDGRCKTFDRSADGYVRGEGAGVVLLKPLARAIADGDRIHAVIRATSVNHGGIANSLTAPNPGAQADLLVKAYRSAGVPPSTVGYVEAHGTGTKLGDPIEVAGLKKAFSELAGFFGELPATQPHCVLGSVKANIGHLESAAGIAGVIKTVLALRNRTIPGLVHFESLNPHIDLDGSPFRIATETAPWLPIRDAGGRTLPLRAGVSSFGFGGSNAHVVLEEWVGSAEPSAPQAGKPELVLLSARNPERLADMAAEFERLASRLAAAGPGEPTRLSFPDLALTLRVGRDAMEYRLAALVEDPKELAMQLRLFLAGEASDRLWSGSNRKGRAALIDADDSDEDRRYLSDLVAGRKLAKLASLWVGGISIDWSLIPRDGAKIVSLPTYRFARESYWLSGNAGPVPGRAPVHPLIDSIEEVGNDAVYRKTFTRGDVLWNDHLVSSDPVLPAAAILEMARAAGANALGQGSACSLRHVVIISPLRSLGSELAVEIVVSRINAGLQFEVHDRLTPEASLRAQGKLVPAAGGAPRDVNADRLDLGGIRRKCLLREPKPALYAGFRRGGLAYGPAYQVIEELWGNDSEALSRLHLPAAAGDPWPTDGISPSLLDGALQTVWGIGEAGEGDEGPLYLPFSVDELEIASPLPAEVFVHAVQTDEAKASRKFEIKISDGEGRILALLKRVVMRRTQTAQLFRPTWRPYGNAADWSQPVLEGPLMVLAADRDQLSSVAALGRGDHRHGPLIGVGLAAEFRRVGDDFFELDPFDPEHFARLWEELKRDGRLPRAVLNLWTWEAKHGEDSDAGVDMLVGLGAGAAFLGLRALMRVSASHDVRWVNVCREEATLSEALNRMVVGFARTLHLEQGRQRCKLVRIAGVGGWEATLAELAEPAAQWSPDVRLGDERCVRGSAALEMEQDSTPVLRKGGVYVISGGAGGLGLILARGLAQRCGVRIALMGRSELGSARSAQFEEIRAIGSEIRYDRVDVRSREQLDGALRRVRAEWGPIAGVIHGAGVIDDALILRKGQDAWSRVLAPKVHGTLHLDAATAADPLDWFVMFSSVIAELGNTGQADYAAANAFMDAYAGAREALREKGLRSGHTLSIGWPWWQDGGMPMPPDAQERLAKKTGFAPLSTAAGVEAFFHALHSRQNHVVVAVGELSKVRERLGVADRAPAIARASGPAAQVTHGAAANGSSSNGVHPKEVTSANGATAGEKARNGASGNGSDPGAVGSSGVKSVNADPASTLREIESKLVEVVSGVLRVKGADMDLETDLGEYGIESVSLMEVVMEIEKIYEIVLEPSALTQHSSIANLARYLLPLVIPAGKAKVEATGNPLVPAAEGAIARESDAVRAAAPSTQPEVARSGPEPIAVIGAAGRFADSANLEEFWTHLRRGGHLVREIPGERWENDDYYSDDPKAPNKTYSKWGSFLADIDAFDAEFFGVKEEDAIGMDPQQRILLELSQELFDRSGYTRGELKGRPVAFFLGAAPSDYTPNRLPYASSIPQRQVIVNQLANMAAARVSDFFNLRGPAVCVDTACSASLVAVHQACQSLRQGECEMAIAGGIQLLIDPSFFVGFSQAGVLSRSGRCAVFDQNADGMVLGEGAGLVLLKPLGGALRDGDRVLATILGSAINNDGHTMGITTPSLEAQQDVIAAAYAHAGIEPSSVSYLEAHGTGTTLGDPIEIKAASQLFRTFTAAEQFCAVGSVKSNIGHLLRAAGIAGFLKVILALENRMIPPTLHCTEPHPRFRFSDSPFYPARSLEVWKPIEGVRRAGISAFGFGGTNCHLLLEEFDASARGYSNRRAPLPSTVFRRRRFWAGRPTVPVEESLSEAGLRELLQGLRMGSITVGEARTLIQR